MNRKRILFVTQYFYPEVFRGNDIAFDLAKDNDVTVVTGVPNYPLGTFFNGYGIFKKNKETINGVKVIRVPVIPRGKGGAVWILLNYFSYAFSASLYILMLGFKKKYDCIFVQQLSPVTMAIPGVLYKMIRKVPLYLWVLDLWPESLQSAGGIKNKFVLGFFDCIVRIIYKNSTKILISSKGFKTSIVGKNVNEEKIIYFPNWAEEVFSETKEISEELPDLLPGFKIMFAGNIGEAQDFEAIMNAALLLKAKQDIKFAIVGDGRKKQWIDSFVRKHQLEDTVQVLGRYPIHTMPAFFEKADIMLVSLKNEQIFNLTAPAKIQAYMASAKPILAMLNGEGAALVNEAACGKSVNAGDYEGLAKEILSLHQTPTHELKEMGENGKTFCAKNFEKQSCINNLISILGVN